MDENFLGHLTLDLMGLQKDAGNISSEWNGDQSGIEEDRAHCADNIKRLAGELIETLNEMQEYGTSNSYSGLFNELIGRNE